MATLTTKIKEAIAGIIDTGAHQNIANTTKFIARKFGLSDRLVNYTHAEIRNKLNESRYLSIPYKERILFLPQCLRHSKKCKADLGEEGWKCADCGSCKIFELRKAAKDLGYGGAFITPGGSMVHKIIAKYKPKAVIGVCCFSEAEMAMDKLQGTKVAHQAVLLMREGCKDTDVNIDEVVEKMKLFEPNSNSEKKA